jgi:hypothetical protein
MFSSNLTKFFALAALIFLLFAGCRFWQKTNGADSSATLPAVADDLKSEIPFTSREPERFQAEIVVTANDSERTTFVARDGANRRWDFNFGAANQLTNLQTDKNYLILPGKKIYAEKTASPALAEPDEWANFLTTEWLSAKHAANYEKLETSDNLTRYRVDLGANNANEVYIYIDETLRLPVRQEFYAVADGQKTLTYRFELKNLKLETDGDIFTLAAGLKKVSAEEFGKILRSEE